MGKSRATHGQLTFTVMSKNNSGPITQLIFDKVGAELPNPNGGHYVLPTDKGTDVPSSGHLVYNIAAIHPNATKVEVVLDNGLPATAPNGGSARIAKRDFRGLTVSLPEPSSRFLALALMLVGSGLVRRRGGIA